MAIYKVESPDGRIIKIEGPDDASPDQVMQEAERLYSQMRQDDKSILESVSDGLRGFTGAVQAGIPFSGDVAALGRSVGDVLTGGDWDFESRKRDVMREREAYAEENPILAFTGSLLGGAVTGGAGAKAVQALAPQRIKQLAQQFPKTATMTTAVGGGATGGAIMGAGEGVTLEERAQKATEGAAIGAITSGIATPLFAVAGKGVGALKDWFGKKYGRSPSDVELAILEALEVDEIKPETALRELDKIAARKPGTGGGGPAMLADVSESTRMLLEKYANRPGPARQVAQKAFRKRAGGQKARILTGARDLMGVDGKYHDTIEDLAKQRTQDAGPLYKEALDVTNVWSPKIEKIIGTKQARKALGEGLDLEQAELAAKGMDFQPTAYAVKEFNEAGDPIISGVPNMKTLHTIKVGLDKIISDGKDPVTGKLNANAISVNNLKNALVDEIDRLNPTYKQARQAWAGPSAMKDAAESGRNFARGDWELTAKEVNKMTLSEKEMFREGAMREMEQMLGSVDGQNIVNRLLNSNRLNALAPTFPDRKSFNRFRKLLKGEARMAGTRQAVVGGSPTGRRESLQRDLPSADVVASAASGDVVGAATGIARNAYNKLASIPELSASDQRKLAKILTDTNLDSQKAVIDRLKKAARMGDIPKDKARIMLRTLGAGAGIAAAGSLNLEEQN